MSPDEDLPRLRFRWSTRSGLLAVALVALMLQCISCCGGLWNGLFPHMYFNRIRDKFEANGLRGKTEAEVIATLGAPDGRDPPGCLAYRPPGSGRGCGFYVPIHDGICQTYFIDYD